MCADIYKNMSMVSDKNQNVLYEIKEADATLNAAEDILRDKIQLKYQQLDNLNKEFTNIMETYSQIIRSSQI